MNAQVNTEQVWPFVGTGRGLEIDHAEGAWLYQTNGEKILDAAGGAIVSNVGHGRQEVVDAMMHGTKKNSYIVPPFLTPERVGLIEQLRRDWLPAGLRRVHMTCSGSEGTETALKVALQHHYAKGEESRHKFIGRDVSYHGTSIMALAVGGHEARKKGVERILPNFLKTPTPYPLRSPLGRHHPDSGKYYADQLEALIQQEGPETIAAFMAESMNGSSGGAITPPDDYWPRVQEICRKYGILLLLDEVMTGFGRTGKRFGFEHWNIEPDIVVSGKGLGGGYAPITGVFATDAVAQPIEAQGMDVMFHTFAALPGACAAASAVLNIMTRENLVERAAQMGEKLNAKLHDALGDHPHVAEIRGKGLLRAIEIVKDRETLELFPLEDNITNSVVGAGLGRGAFFYPGGTGVVRDIICLGPPYIVTEDEIEFMVDTLKASIDHATLS
ncbi:MAG: aminotransferase class III-fold pyridoxal phosphate-dependent enzyme [Pseudomonadota bacterium]